MIYTHAQYTLCYSKIECKMYLMYVLREDVCTGRPSKKEDCTWCLPRALGLAESVVLERAVCTHGTSLSMLSKVHCKVQGPMHALCEPTKCSVLGEDSVVCTFKLPYINALPDRADQIRS